jgi:isoleucyl-tRNA synthetase
MTRLMAPVLSFTSDEAWQSLRSPTTPTTIFEQTAHTIPTVPNAEPLLAKWSLVRQARADVLKAIEVEREAGRVGSSLQASVHISAGAAMADALATLGDELKFVMITSQAQWQADPTLPADHVRIRVTALTDPKCGRCWHLRADVGAHAEHPDLCGRCISNLFGKGEVRGIA